MHKRKERESNISRQNWRSPENLALMAAKRKSGGRWMACRNLEPHREEEEEEEEEEEDNFSSGADASALCILVWVAARGQWCATTLDVRTAFLNV